MRFPEFWCSTFWRRGGDHRNEGHPKGKAPTVASLTRQVEAIRQARHMKQLLPKKVENTPKGVRLTFDVDHEEKRRLMTRLFGKTILFTDQADWSTEDIVLGYPGQYKLEDGFRTLKDSDACCWWPMHHWTDQKISVYGFFCVLALLLLSLLQRQLAQKGIDISIARLIRHLTEIQETALAYAPRPSARGKTKVRSVYVLTKMDTEQRALFDALDLVRYQHPTMQVPVGLTCNSLMCREFPGCGRITRKLGLGGARRSCADYLLLQSLRLSS